MANRCPLSINNRNNKLFNILNIGSWEDKDKMTRFAVYDLWFYGGILMMGFSVMLFAVQAVFYIIKKAGIRKKLDEEYGQPQKYHIRDKG